MTLQIRMDNIPSERLIVNVNGFQLIVLFQE